jgi:hypothetical protein
MAPRVEVAPATVAVIQCVAGNVATWNAWELADDQGTVGKLSASSLEVPGSRSKFHGSPNFESRARTRSRSATRGLPASISGDGAGPGAKCSPRSSAAQSYSTGLRTSCPYHALGTIVALGTFVACTQLVDLACIGCAAARLVDYASSLFNVRSFRARIFVLLARILVGFVLLINELLAAGVRFLYGGEDDEAIRFMEPEPVQEPVQEPAPTRALDRERELEVLKSVVGVSGAGYFGKEGDTKSQFGVQLKVRPHPGADRVPIRVPCAGDKPTQAHAARVAQRRVAAILGDAAVEAAELLVTERRAAAGPSAGVARNVNAVLGETQRLRALLRAAETRADAAEQAARRAEAEAAEAAAAIIRAPEEARKAAWLELEAAQAAVDAHAKKQRVESEAPAVKEPEWRSRPYAAYDTVDKWVKREGVLWNRRRVKLSADKPGRSAEQLKPRAPHGNDGPLNHWRRSVVDAVQDWAEGSKADAAKIIFWVIEECDFKLTLPKGAPQKHQQLERAKKQQRQTAEMEFDPKQRWRLERDLDGDTREVCEAT